MENEHIESLQRLEDRLDNLNEKVERLLDVIQNNLQLSELLLRQSMEKENA